MANVSPPDDQENPLEHLLRLAKHDAGLRPELYRLLLESHVYILLPEWFDAEQPVSPDTHIPFIEWAREDGVRVVPFFSSMNTLRQGAPQAKKAASFPVRGLFAALPGKVMHLNPNCEFGFVLHADEIHTLLTHGMLGRPAPFSDEAFEGTVVDPVTDPPADLVSALITLYARTPSIEAAYLVRVSPVNDEARSTLLIAVELDASGTEPDVASDSYVVVEDTYQGDEAVDLAFIKRNPDMWEGIRGMTSPFYDRSWGPQFIATILARRASGPSTDA